MTAPRLFLAAWPSDDVIVALRGLPRLDEVGVRPVREQNWHVTLRFLGDVGAADVVAAIDDAVLPTAAATIGPEIVRLDERQIVVPVAGVDELAAAIRGATSHLGEPDRHTFVGHLTVARTRPNAASRLVGHRFDAAFAVTEIALVESELLPDGARYTTVATWPTRAP